MTLFRLPRVCIASLVFCAALGCAPRDEIRVYEAASDPPDRVVRKPVTLIAALVPQSKRTNWVFKVAGPADAVADARAAILEFFKTVEFPKEDVKKVADDDEEQDEPLVWKLPAGWTEAKGGGEFRSKSVSIPTKGEPLDLSVSNLGRAGARLKDNVNRWRRQIHRNPITEKELPLMTKKFAMAGVEATLVEIKGFQLTLPEEREPFQYVVPPGWQKGKKTAISALSFKVEQNELKQAVITVSVTGGTLEANLNRWRDQVKLPPQEKNVLLKEAKALKIAGRDAVYVDYTAAAGNDLEQRRILGAVVTLQDDQVFVKMTGPADLVEREKANFERFASSLLPAKEDD